MQRFIAFLRAINVGGRNVKMEELRRVFEAAGFARVETFIASGNVVFEATARDAAALERKVAARLRDALGYEVATFVRTEGELAEVARYEPFPRADLGAAGAINVAFVAEAPDAEAVQRLMKLRTEVDDLSVRGREVYWLCRARRQSESKVSNAALERALGQPTTVRSVNTVRRMAERFCRRGPAGD
jgi:uncharacterized protein (DUF1697 family)